MKRYTVELTNLERLYKAYEGKSRDKAAELADTLRAALVIGSGSGTVTLRVNGIADVVWVVTQGEAFLALIGGACK